MGKHPSSKELMAKVRTLEESNKMLKEGVKTTYEMAKTWKEQCGASSGRLSDWNVKSGTAKRELKEMLKAAMARIKTMEDEKRELKSMHDQLVRLVDGLRARFKAYENAHTPPSARSLEYKALKRERRRRREEETGRGQGKLRTQWIR